MAVQVHTPTLITVSGIAGTLTAANTTLADGEQFANSVNKTYVEIVNANANDDVTATFDYVGTLDSLAVVDPAVAIVHGTRKLIGPFTSGYHQAGSSNVLFHFTAGNVVTGVTIGVFKV